MNGEVFEQLQSVLEPLGLEVGPRPSEGEEVECVDITPEMGEMSPARVLNAIGAAIDNREMKNLNLEVLGAHPQVITLRDETSSMLIR